MASLAMRRLAPDEVAALRRAPVDGETLRLAEEIVSEVRLEGERALRRHAERFSEVGPGAPLLIGRDALRSALEGIDPAHRAVLERTAERIRRFADAQRASVRPVEFAIPGGFAGQELAPVERAGCYAPGGRFPLPSSVLMTAVTARAAGVQSVIVASPRPAPVTLAAASVAGADCLLAAGGAHAIAALAYGAGPVEPCAVVVGPGSRWVTAAKKLVAGAAGIDMLAGPSELVVIADANADASMVAADLLAQAEHDTDAFPVLIVTDARLADRVEAALAEQLATLPTAETARTALRNGFIVVARDLDEAARVSDELAPEHLQLLVAEPEALHARLRHYGGLFIGADAAEVLGDYGAGPNHTLPTGGSARFAAGLSVFNFLRIRTWLRIDDAAASQEAVRDAVSLARMEGLEAHARAAERRLR
ncbi:MAG: histidinol dehydrogenase [Candidatus Sumerlaeia bacterium]|nr:histidinol dehydrogenase [Candidatus Sumerlaeia bacterium]